MSTEPTQLRPITRDEATGTQVAAVIDRTHSTASERIAALRKAVDGLEQMLLADAAEVKLRLENHIAMGECCAKEVERLNDVVVELRGQHARLINARVEG